MLCVIHHLCQGDPSTSLNPCKVVLGQGRGCEWQVSAVYEMRVEDHAGQLNRTKPVFRSKVWLFLPVSHYLQTTEHWLVYLESCL